VTATSRASALETVLYHPHAATTSAAPAAEYFTLQDGVIVESLLVFDRPSFAPPSEC
jgi:hypothetical protein